MILKLKDLDLHSAHVLVRVDFNVPMTSEGEIRDDSRIYAAVPTIQSLIDAGAKVILMSHLGRPKGPDLDFTLRPCARRLEKIIGKPVEFVDDCIGEEVEKEIFHMKEGEILLLENLRFYEAEENPEKDSSFAKALSDLADFYINDAFGTAHRVHSSTAVITQYFPEKAAAGLLLCKEIEALGSSLLNPKRPFVAIIGGAKVSTKLGVLRSLLEKADALIIGGAMAYTFMRAVNLRTGDSPVEERMIEDAKEILSRAKEVGKKILFPVDIVVSSEFSEAGKTKTIGTEEGIPDGFQGMDIGPKTLEEWRPTISHAKTIFWNGPVGVFELTPFAAGTRALAELIAGCSKAFTVVGGGDSIAALEQTGLQSAISHISTGGGASLEFIEHGTLPGLQALEQAAKETQ
jgi:phosphoglycerate kinase